MPRSGDRTCRLPSEVTTTTQDQFVPSRSIRPLKYTSSQVGEVRFGDGCTTKFYDALVGVEPPVGLCGDVRLTIRCALFPLVEIPTESASESTRDRLTRVRIDRSRFGAFTEEQGIFQLREMVNTVVLRDALVIPRAIILHRLLQRGSSKLKRRLEDLGVVGDVIGIPNATSP